MDRLTTVAKSGAAEPPTGLLAKIWKRLRQQNDPEPEQALIRLAIGVLITTYFALIGAFDGTITPVELYPIKVGLIFCAVSMVVVGHILFHPVPTVWRRVFGMCIDLGTTTHLMAHVGAPATPMFMVYLWVTFGNGFRYGTNYLYMSSALSVVGMMVVITTSPYWDQHMPFAWGLVASLVVLPGYVSVLIRKLNLAVQRANEASQAKSQFLARMSHELRTPLNGVIGMTHILMQTRLDKEQKEIAETVVTSGKLLNSLIENVLDFSKIEAGKIDIEKAQIDLHALLNGIATVFTRQARTKGLNFAVHIAPDVPYAIIGDPTHLRQVIVNLVGNAIKFTEQGYVELNVSLLGEDQNHRCVIQFSIEDTGPGIPPEAQERIFDSFTQADSSTTRRYGGTGLGTTIAKQLVELMGGTISLSSTLGQGSAFVFTLPVEYQVRNSGNGKPGRLDACRTLVLSNNKRTTDPVVGMLKLWGVQHDVVTHSSQAFGRLLQSVNEGHNFDVVLIDSAGVDIYPRQFCSAIRADPSLRSVAMILLRAETDTMAATEYLRAGFASVLISPPETRQLYNALHAVIAREDDADGVAALVDHVPERGKPATSAGLNVLVAEDNPVNQDVVRRILQSAGHAVTIVTNGDQALDALEEHSYDLVIADMRMPGMNGLEAMKVHKFTFPDKHIPWIILTGDATQATMKECEAAGVDVYLTKPVNPLVLLANVQRLAGNASRTYLPRKPERMGSATAPRAEPAVFDPRVLDELAALGKQDRFVERAVQRFTEDSLMNIDAMRNAMRGGDYEAMRHVAHSLKGSSASVGAVALAELSAVICRLTDRELAGRSGDLMHDLVAAYEHTAVHLNRYATRQSHGGR